MLTILCFSNSGLPTFRRTCAAQTANGGMSQWRPRVLKSPNTENLTVYITKRLKAELGAEAREDRRSLSDYVRGLLSRRGKWARSVGKAGGYDIGGNDDENN
jgi:hypothetical protein